MSFYIDPKLKQIGASEMKDWVIFGLIVGFLLLIQYNVTVSHNRDIERMRVTIADVQSDIEWLVSEHHKDHTVPDVVPVPVITPPPPKIHIKPKVVKPPLPPVKVTPPRRRPMSNADMEF